MQNVNQIYTITKLQNFIKAQTTNFKKFDESLVKHLLKQITF